MSALTLQHYHALSEVAWAGPIGAISLTGLIPDLAARQLIEPFVLLNDTFSYVLTKSGRAVLQAAKGSL